MNRQALRQKVVLGLLVYFPDLRQALCDLLIMNAELSVQKIYTQLPQAFYKILQDLHGERTANRPCGHRLLHRFPVLKADPPPDFVSRCVDHLVLVLRMGQMADEIDHLKTACESDDASMRLLELVRDYQAQCALVNNADSALAEEAKELRRAALGPVEWGTGMAA